MAGADRRLSRDLRLQRPPPGDGASVPPRRSHPRPGRRESGRVVNELFAMAVWVGASNARVTRIAVTAYLAAQTSKLAPVMKKLRKGLLPITLLAVGFAPFTQSH